MIAVHQFGRPWGAVVTGVFFAGAGAAWWALSDPTAVVLGRGIHLPVWLGAGALVAVGLACVVLAVRQLLVERRSPPDPALVAAERRRASRQVAPRLVWSGASALVAGLALVPLSWHLGAGARVVAVGLAVVGVAVAALGVRMQRRPER